MAMIQATAMSMRPTLRFFMGFMFSLPSVAHRTLPKHHRAAVLCSWSIMPLRSSSSNCLVAGLIPVMFWRISTTWMASCSAVLCISRWDSVQLMAGSSPRQARSNSSAACQMVCSTAS